VCGDGIKAGTEECDDGNNIDGDGCNADCTIGNNNNCSESTPFIDPITNSCASNCPIGYFPDNMKFSCNLCSVLC
jgi:cysteine-rich repeat protein